MCGIPLEFLAGHHAPVVIDDFGVERQLLVGTASLDRSLQVDACTLLAHLRGGELCAPYGYVDGLSLQQMHVAVEPGAAVPARGLLHVFQPYGQGVLRRIGAQGIADVAVERVVAVGPEHHLLSVDVDMGLAHGTVEDEHGAPCGARGTGIDGEVAAVPSHSHVGQSAGAAGMFGGFRLTVLCDGYCLQVVVAAEGTIDGPVMRNHYLLPFGIIKIHSLCTRHITFHKTGLGKLLGLKGKGHSNAGKQKKESSFHRYYQIVSLLRDKDT